MTLRMQHLSPEGVPGYIVGIKSFVYLSLKLSKLTAFSLFLCCTGYEVEDLYPAKAGRGQK